MTKGLNSRSVGRALPVFWIGGAITALVGCFWLGLVELSKPTIYPNPGLAAYAPPPETRLLPIARESNAPELADLPDDTPSPVTAFAKAQMGEGQDKLDAHPPTRKHVRAVPRENDQRPLGYAEQWNYGRGDWNGNRAGSAPHKFSGGPKSWF